MPKEISVPTTLDEMMCAPGYLIRRLHQRSTAAFMDETEGCDLTPIQFSALVVIHNSPDTDAATLSDLISFDRTTVGQVLARLEDKGLIVRKPERMDRRRKVLSITQAGKDVLARASQAIPHVENKIWGRLDSDERETLKRLLQKLVAPSLETSVADAAE